MLHGSNTLTWSCYKFHFDQVNQVMMIYILLWNCLSEGEQLVFSTSPSWIQSTIFVCIFPALFDKGVFFLIIFDLFLKKILWIVYFSSPTMKKLFSEDWKWCCHFSKGTIFPKLIPPLLLTKSSSHSTFIFKYIHISNLKCTTEMLSAKFKIQETVDSQKWQVQKMVAVLVAVSKVLVVEVAKFLSAFLAFEPLTMRELKCLCWTPHCCSWAFCFRSKMALLFPPFGGLTLS